MQSTAVEQDAQRVAQTAPQEQPQRQRIPLLNGGMRTDKAPGDLAQNEAVYIHNLNLNAGLLRTDTGYAPFGGTFIGQAQTTYQVFNPDGTASDFLITTKTVYTYNQAVVQYQLVSFGAAYSVSHVGGYPVGTSTFALVSTAGLSNGQTFGVGQSDGSQLIGTITNVAGGAVTLNVSSTQTVNNGAPCALAITLNGDVSGQIQVVIVEFPAFGTIISNGVDPIFYFNGSILQNLTGLPTATTCRAMCVAHEQLLLSNLTENGTDLPQRLRASDQANPQQWTPGNGIAAIYDLIDTEDFILSLNILGPWVIVYRETTVMRGTFLGLPNQTWFWEYMIYGEGAVSQGAVAEIGDTHFFVGQAGLYLYDGSYSLESIGDGVFFNFFSALGTINSSARSTIFTQYVGDFDECWVFLPTGTSTFPNEMLRVDLEHTGWFHRAFFDTFVSCQPRLTIQKLTWATAPGTWASHTETWDSRIFLQNVPNFFLCSPTLSTVMVYDYTIPTDNGNTIAWEVITRQFGDVSAFSRWERLILYGTGMVDVQYSEDEGNTFVDLGTINLGATPSAASVYIDHTSQQILFKLSGTAANFALRYADIISEFESEW